jgi:tyrosinase
VSKFPSRYSVEDIALKTKLSNRYWDWTLDYQAFKNSPIWDPYTGFGGNGNTSIGQSVGKGNCVTDGPFSTLRPVYYNQTYNPHCLSRGFGIGNDSEEILIHRFDQVAIEKLLRRDSYEEFLAQLEGSIHDSIHRLVGGDFRAWTAPNGEREIPVHT